MAPKKKISSVYVSWPRPDFTQTIKTNKNFRSHYNAALLYAHYELSAIELKKEVTKYLKVKDPKHPLLSRIKDMNDNRFTTIGKYMYILNHGADVPDNILPGIMLALEKIVDEEERKIAAAEKESQYITSKEGSHVDLDSTPKVGISIQDRIKEKASTVSGEVEGWIDEFILNKQLPIKSVDEFVNFFKSNDLKSPHIRHVESAFKKSSLEVSDVLANKDKDLSEGYSNFSKPELKKFDLFYTNLFKACEMFHEIAKVERAPQKKKPVSQEKIVAKVKFKKEDSSLGIASINPINIINAKELWTYNVKTRKLGHYKAIAGESFSFKGTTLLNYSPDSVEKTLRKPAVTLAEFKSCSKVKLRTFMQGINSVDIPCKGKLTEYHILLRVDK